MKHSHLKKQKSLFNVLYPIIFMYDSVKHTIYLFEQKQHDSKLSPFQRHIFLCSGTAIGFMGRIKYMYSACPKDETYTSTWSIRNVKLLIKDNLQQLLMIISRSNLLYVGSSRALIKMYIFKMKFLLHFKQVKMALFSFNGKK